MSLSDVIQWILAVYSVSLFICVNCYLIALAKHKGIIPRTSKCESTEDKA